MKKTLKKLVTMTLALLLVSISLIPAYATQVENEVMPLYNTAIGVTSNPNISATGLLTVTASYTGDASQFTRVVVTSYVEKRNLLLFWDRVDIGTTNNEWVNTSTSGYFSTTHSAQMPASGTYRVTTTFDVYSGSTLLDSISKTTKLSY